MKKIIFIGVVILLVIGFGKLNKYMSDKIYEECMQETGNQETCYIGAYQG